jgi:hypothetical protein
MTYGSDQSGGSETSTWVDDPNSKNYVYTNKNTGAEINPYRLGAYDIPDKGTYFYNLTPTGFQTEFNPRATGLAPVLSSFLAMTPLAPVAAAYNAYKAIDSGNVIGGLANLATLGGFSGLANELSIANAIKSGNVAGALSAIAQSPISAGLANTDIGGFKLGDVAKGAALVANLTSNTPNYALALQAAGQLAGSPDTVMAGKGLALVNALTSGNPAAILNAATALGSTVNNVAPGAVKVPVVEGQGTTVTGDAGADAILAASQGVGQIGGSGTQVAAAGTDTRTDATNPVVTINQLTPEQRAAGYYIDEEGNKRNAEGQLVIESRGTSSSAYQLKPEELNGGYYYDDNGNPRDPNGRLILGSGQLASPDQDTSADTNSKARQIIAMLGMNAEGTAIANTGSPNAKYSAWLGSTKGQNIELPPGFFAGTVFDTPEQQKQFELHWLDLINQAPETEKDRLRKQLEDIQNSKVVETPTVDTSKTTETASSQPSASSASSSSAANSAESAAASAAASSAAASNTPPSAVTAGSSGAASGPTGAPPSVQEVETQVEKDAGVFISNGVYPADAWSKALAKNGLREGDLTRPSWAVPGGGISGQTVGPPLPTTTGPSGAISSSQAGAILTNTTGAISTLPIGAVSTSPTGAVSSSTIGAISSSQIPASTAQIGAATTGSNALTSSQIAALTSSQVGSGTSHIATLTSGALGMSTSQVAALTSGAVGLGTSQIAALSSGLSTLGTAQIAALTSAPVSIATSQIPAATTTPIAVVTSQIAAMTTSPIGLSTTQIPALTSTQVAALTSKAPATISTTTVPAANAEAALAPETIPIFKVGDLGKYVSPLAAYEALVQQMYNTAMDEKTRQQPKEKKLDSDTSFWGYGQQEKPLESIFGSIGSLFGEPEIKAATGGSIAALMAAGGAQRTGIGSTSLVPHSGKMRVDFRHGDAVTGPGDGQSDDIPAMLADGEFVFPADVVSALGNGSTKAGSDKLYEMMHSIRARARKAHPKSLPPPAKSPLEYLRGKK